MNTYIAYWPNKTITVLTASSEWELFDTLDREGNPDEAKVFILPRKFAVTTEVKNGDIEFDETQSLKDLKEFNFSHNIQEYVFC